MEIKLLKKGDPCPCCGCPILKDDHLTLLTLTWIQAIKDGDTETERFLEKLLKEITKI